MIFRNQYNQNNYNNMPIRDDRNVNIEISYDNFDTVNLDMAKKIQYGNDLRLQMAENERKKKAELEKNKLEDLEEELRLKRERELLEQRQNEENKRYRPQINLPIQTIKVEKKEKINNRRYTPPPVNIVKKNTLSDSALNYLRDRGNQIDDFNDKMMKSLQLLNKEYQYNINSLRGQIGALNDSNKKYKDRFYKEVYDIKENLDYRKKQDRIDGNNLYDLVAKSNYANQMLKFNIGSVPRRNFEIRSYTSNKVIPIDDERKGDGLTVPSYINFSRDVPYHGPRWRQNESVWWCY